ncbi:MAG TPA: hypothetical protein VE913_22775, partial [Longimicrobium sp.]|nr:hypothetical protein [Longimicrobium sp.]
MAEAQNGSPKPPPTRYGRGARTAVFWAAIVLVSILLVSLNTSRQAPSAPIQWWQFQQQLAAGNITEVQVIEGA